MARATTPETEARLEAETDSARQVGVFGSPTFVVGMELFWGDDRLEDALAYASSAA
jgi:2-hydroxychromene-2-carboxylate isomerase